MRRALHLVGATALVMAAAVVTTAAAHGLTALGQTRPIPWMAGIVGGPLLGGGIVTVRETRRVLADGGFGVTTTDAVNLCAVTVAAPVTRWLAVEAELGPVVASALVGLLAALFVSAYAVPIYCGSFVGMVGPGVFADLLTVTEAGLVAGLVFVVAKRVFNGFGGKLGTTAFVGCGVVALATGATPATPSGFPTPAMALGFGVVAGLAAAVTFAVSIRLDHGPVMASATVGLVAGLLAPAVVPAGGRVAAVAFCASFVGMARPDRLPTAGTVLATGLLAGGLYVGALPYLTGVGGKLGTIAFVACLATAGLRAVGDRVPALIRVAAR